MKQVSSKRKRRPSREKKERRMRAAKALAAAGAIAGGTQAYAAPVRFDNPAHGESGHFHWSTPAADPPQWLDAVLPADQQPSGAGVTSLRDLLFANGSVVDGESSPQVQISGYYQLAGVEAGEAIPSGVSWYGTGYTHYPGYGTLLPEGVPTYLGIRFDLGGGYQYGWIGVVMTGHELEPFAWGYETEPAVPIAAGAGGGGEAIPTVSEYGLMAMGLGVLAAGAWTLRKRRGVADPA